MTKFAEIRKLSSEGNFVATAVYNLLQKPYAETKDGFKEAVEDGSDAFDQLLQKYQHPIYRADSNYMRLGLDTPSSPYSRLLDHAGVVGQVWPGHIGGIPNKPGPLTSMMVLGSLGGLAGYGTGKALGALGLPSRGQKVTTAIGAGLGMLPGILMMSGNYAGGNPVLDSSTFALPRRRLENYDPGLIKTSAEFKTAALIPVEGVKDYVWSDPSLPPSLAAATTALVEGANRMSPERNDLPFVTPSDMGRMAVGLGSGYLTGMVAGKVLGGLFGVSDRSQQVLRNSGMAAGLIKAIVPTVFPG